MNNQEFFHHGGMRYAPARRTSLRLLYLTLLLVFQYQVRAQVVINEIMFAPHSPEPEWVELLNADTVAHTLENIYIHDATSRALIPKIRLEVGAFAVLCKDTASLNLCRKIPAGTQVVKMSLPSLNNSGEALYLVTKDSVVLDSLSYSDTLMISGRSVERVDARVPVRAFGNLHCCEYLSGASCGSVNSVAPMQRDLAVAEITIDTSSLSVHFRVRNMSRDSSDQATVSITINSTPFCEVPIPRIAKSAEFEWWIPIDSVQKQIASYGECTVRARVTLVGDQRSQNDSAMFFLSLSPPIHSILINEIHYDPRPEQSEFVELYNTLSQEINLKGLVLCDGSGGQLRVDSNCQIRAHGYMVLSKDSFLYDHFQQLRSSACGYIGTGSFSLRSSGDAVCLRDSYNKHIDSLSYLPSWHSDAAAETKGRSLEKVSPLLRSDLAWSWTTCTDSSGVTPGALNSVARNIASVPELHANPNPFSPRSVIGWRQSTAIQLHVNSRQTQLLVRIFDTEGRFVRELDNGFYSSSECNLLWDGRNAAGFVLPMGAYILSVESIDVISHQSAHQAMVIVIGE